MDSSVLLAMSYAVSALVASGVAGSVWRLWRVTPAAGALIVAMTGLAGWCCADVAQVLVAPDLRSAAAMAGYVGVDVTVAGFLCVAIATADPQWAPRRPIATLLAVKPCLTVLASVTNRWHDLLHLTTPAPYGWKVGPLFWAHTAVSYLLLTAAAVLLLRGWIFAARQHRRQISELIIAMTVPIVVNVLVLLHLTGSDDVDLTPMALAVSGCIAGHAVVARGSLRIAPVAREFVLEWIGDAVIMASPDGQVSDLNPAAERLARLLRPALPEDLVGLDVSELLGRPLTSFGTAGREHPVRTERGTMDLDVRVTPLPRHRWMAGGWVVVIRDVTELSRQRRELAAVNEQLRDQVRDNERLRAELAEQARRDPLTGLHNRRHLSEQLAQLLTPAGGEDPVGVILLDIDYFKQVNDVHGHAVGDDLLAAVARELAACLPAGAVLVRYGGEEFVMLLPGWSLPRSADHAEAVRLRCAQVAVPGRHGDPVRCTVSAGVAASPASAASEDALLAAADDALYLAKAGGRNQVVTSCQTASAC